MSDALIILTSFILVFAFCMLYIWLSFPGKQARELTCILDETLSAIEIRPGIALEGVVEIFYQGDPIENLFLKYITLKNTGRLEIAREDVRELVTFTFAQDVEIVRVRSYVAENARPKQLAHDWHYDRDASTMKVRSASLEFDLLNPHEQLTVEFLCTGNPYTKPEINARIKRLPAIRTLYRKERVEIYQELRRFVLKITPILTIFILFYLAQLWLGFNQSTRPLEGTIRVLYDIAVGGLLGIVVFALIMLFWLKSYFSKTFDISLRIDGLTEYMPMKPITQNPLFYGDNLPILWDYIPTESVDLVYLDPPFNSQRTYNVLFKHESGRDQN